MLNGINHITLAVSDLAESIEFYTMLGFTPHVAWEAGAYLSLGGLWLCVSLDQVDTKLDYGHIALDVDDADFEQVCQLLVKKGVKEWKDNTSEGKSIYILDPSGNKLEIHVGTLNDRLDQLRSKPYKGLVWF